MNILITGAASGIGCAAADFFIKQGHFVFGIDVATMEERDNFLGFAADITDERALEAVRDYFCENGILLDVILNIAGKHIMTSLVENACTDMKRVVEINLMGAVLVNRIFHKCLDKTGRIVIVTSEVAGFDPLPFNGLYNVTKTALDAYAQALRQELNLIGQTVVTVRPGAVETPLCSGSVSATKTLAETTVLYEKQAKNFSGLAAKFMGKPISPDKLAAIIYKAATAKHPKLIYCKNRNIGLVLLALLPKRLQCAVIKLLLSMNLF